MSDEQTLLITAYTEEYGKWSKEVTAIESDILRLENKIHKLKHNKDKLWERILWRLFRRPTKRQNELATLEVKLNQLNQIYATRIIQQPDIDRYELALLGNNIFKVK